jgi:transposase-like protein
MVHMAKRRTFTPQFKAKLAIKALKEEQTVGEIAQEHNVNPALIRRWRDELVEGADTVYDLPKKVKEDKRREEAFEAERAELLRAVGSATVERDWLHRVYKGLSGGEEPPRVGQG